MLKIQSMVLPLNSLQMLISLCSLVSRRRQFWFICLSNFTRAFAGLKNSHKCRLIAEMQPFLCAAYVGKQQKKP